MAGNRKQGFMRGSASGRNGNGPKPWHCAGCCKEHGARVSRTLLAGSDYCDRTYLKIKEAQFAEISKQRENEKSQCQLSLFTPHCS